MYYIQQRSKSYYFRIAVPLDLRSSFPVREIKKSLGKISQRQAQALAGQLALDTLNTFDRVRAGISMAKGDMGLVTIYSGTSKIVIDRSDAAEEALIAEAYARGAAAPEAPPYPR
jgi:hypothetical protein